MQAGQNQVGLFGRDGLGHEVGHRERPELLFFDVNGAIGALGQRLANGLGGARRSAAQNDHLAAVPLLELEAFFQGVGVGLIDLVAQLVLDDPEPGWVDPQSRVAGGNLFDGHDNLHTSN